MRLGMEEVLSPGDIVLDGDPATIPSKKGRHSRHGTRAHVCCGQTARWIKMPLNMEVCLGTGNIVLDGDTALPEIVTAAPTFGQMSIVAKWLCIKMPLGTRAVC